MWIQYYRNMTVFVRMYISHISPSLSLSLSISLSLVAQSIRYLTRKSGALGSIPGLATYFRFSFRFFKKDSCQLLAKVCNQPNGLWVKKVIFFADAITLLGFALYLSYITGGPGRVAQSVGHPTRKSGVVV